MMSRGLLRLVTTSALLAIVSGCSMFGGSEPEMTATAGPAPTVSATPVAGEIDPRKFLGPDYCPEIRIREGTELVRSYEPGRDGDPAAVIWQASVGETARECLYDTAGNLTLRVGVSGRVIAGPRGGAQTVAVPLRIAVVKHKEAVLANELHPLNVAIPPGNSAVFTEVREVTVPSPGSSRDYIVYVGFDEKGENLLDPGAARIASAPEPARPAAVAAAAPAAAPARSEPAPAAPPPQAAQPRQPAVLPTPSSGFVLSQ